MSYRIEHQDRDFHPMFSTDTGDMAWPEVKDELDRQVRSLTMDDPAVTDIEQFMHSVTISYMSGATRTLEIKTK